MATPPPSFQTTSIHARRIPRQCSRTRCASSRETHPFRSLVSFVKRLLKEGHHVVGLPGERKKADLVTELGAFDDIVQVFHLAGRDFQLQGAMTEIVDPCVLGTLNVLNAWKQSTTVKRVVCTSSVASVSARNDLMNRCGAPQTAAVRLRSHGLFRSGWIRSSRRRCSSSPPCLYESQRHWKICFFDQHELYRARQLPVQDASQAPNRPPPPPTRSRSSYFTGFNSTKLQDDLGIQFKSLEQMFEDCVDSFERKGLITRV
ncbi:hypothetical protein SELMODRAFT_413045 [Selaginella moellendorffii]|uniref:3-beta hydroxysteroid dehydrogenase/isomerase domain-containing protein n=1 Tax=Selaginella moellendorffii TaxID=88036 RepID=D8RN60_SELML|nr:hypothetical protein SELMODRAFT_413045 [Selaginella moellendorffii]